MGSFPAINREGPPLRGPSAYPASDGQAPSWDSDGTFAGWASYTTADEVDTAINDALSGLPTPVTDHGALTGLGDDDHSQYVALAGRAGGQVIIGGTTDGSVLQIKGSSGNGVGKGGKVYVATPDDNSVGGLIVEPLPNGTTNVSVGGYKDHSFSRIYFTGQDGIVRGNGGWWMSSSATSTISTTRTGITKFDDFTTQSSRYQSGSTPCAHRVTNIQFTPYTDATRPTAGVAGRVIYNSDDTNLNIDDGAQWRLPDGTIT